MKLVDTYRQILNELFEVDETLKIRGVEQKPGIVYYLIDNFDTIKDEKSKRISILYGIYVVNSEHKVVSPGFEWGTIENLNKYHLSLYNDENENLNEIYVDLHGMDQRLDKSASAWVKAVGLCPMIMKHFGENFGEPNVYSIFSKEEQKNKLYKSTSFINSLQKYLGDKFDIHNELFNCVYLTNKEMNYSPKAIQSAINYANMAGIKPQKS